LKVAATLLSVLGALAAVLAAVGLYCVMAYAVAQRTHEVGIRMALGARPRQVRAMVVRQGMGFAVAGLTLGVLIAAVATRLVEGMLVGVSVGDPITFATASASLALVALLACYVPARRATKVDPMIALRCQ
jgi:putative ABC transport system permease protein